MIPRPPRSTRTDTLFPYPTLFRSDGAGIDAHRLPASDAVGDDARKRAQRLWTCAPHLNKKKGEPWDRLRFSGRFSYWWRSFMRYGSRCFSDVSGIEKTIRPKRLTLPQVPRDRKSVV